MIRLEELIAQCDRAQDNLEWDRQARQLLKHIPEMNKEQRLKAIDYILTDPGTRQNVYWMRSIAEKGPRVTAALSAVEIGLNRASDNIARLISQGFIHPTSDFFLKIHSCTDLVCDLLLDFYNPDSPSADSVKRALSLLEKPLKNCLTTRLRQEISTDQRDMIESCG